jgi:hypothetical protein
MPDGEPAPVTAPGITVRPDTAASDLLQTLSPAERSFLAATSLVRLTTAARWLEVTPASLRRHVHDGECAGRKFDGAWFVGRGTVERWRLRHRRHERG